MWSADLRGDCVPLGCAAPPLSLLQVVCWLPVALLLSPTYNTPPLRPWVRSFTQHDGKLSALPQTCCMGQR